MPPLLLLLLLLHSVTAMAVSADDEGAEFFKNCPPTTCGEIEIKFPFRLDSSPSHCSIEGLVLSCSGNQTRLTPYPSLAVIAIDYIDESITIDVSGFWPPCPLGNLSSLQLSNSYLSLSRSIYIRLVSCSDEFKFDPEQDMIAGPVDCLSGSGRFVYAVVEWESMDKLPSDCVMVSTGGEIPRANYRDSFGDIVSSLFSTREVTMRWFTNIEEMAYMCGACERTGMLCGFSKMRNFTFCFEDPHRHDPKVAVSAGPKVAVIAVKIFPDRVLGVYGTSVAAFVLLVAITLTVVFISAKADKEKETRLRVEVFLASYKTTKPTRYSYADVKKITRRFKRKLGQGGFGSVYEGELPNGVPVAVKMLESSKGDGEDFINEVATIGRIHHVNVVRLLGFCSQGTRRALIYEFMRNESLEKFIFLTDASRAHRPFRMRKLLQIAIGIARGIEYLHQGCDIRILHFDIKPHNILLDYDFNPKISDFGLAKLCSRDQSIITMTAARGTMGYIAPEVYSRNFGTVSYKSDVYSFGMLLLEMVGGRKNIDPSVENQSEIYFPEWVYEQLVHGHNLELKIEMISGEEEIVKKLAIVALWCIQWSPADRPTMTRVVQMLMGDSESLEMPPKPFVSSSDQENASSLSGE